MGGVLVEVSDRKALLKDLEQTLATLNDHLARFTDREAQLMATYEELQAVLKGSE
jgi:chaperonin cofactor prefoldin